MPHFIVLALRCTNKMGGFQLPASEVNTVVKGETSMYNSFALSLNKNTVLAKHSVSLMHFIPTL
jgi:hypothetical protein